MKIPWVYLVYSFKKAYKGLRQYFGRKKLAACFVITQDCVYPERAGGRHCGINMKKVQLEMFSCKIYLLSMWLKEESIIGASSLSQYFNFLNFFNFPFFKWPWPARQMKRKIKQVLHLWRHFFSERLENFFAVLRVPIFEAKELNYSAVSKVNEHR